MPVRDATRDAEAQRESDRGSVRDRHGGGVGMTGRRSGRRKWPVLRCPHGRFWPVHWGRFRGRSEDC